MAAIIEYGLHQNSNGQWQTKVEKLLRFPGVDASIQFFRPGISVQEIAIALGATDENNNVAENWVPVAKRVFEVQQCCLLRAKEIDFKIATNGWVTRTVTADWCARVLDDVQRNHFFTTCIDLVPFVLKTYLRKQSWVRYRWPRGRQDYKRIRETLKPHPIANCCAMVASGFTVLLKEARKNKVRRLLGSRGDASI